MRPLPKRFSLKLIQIFLNKLPAVVQPVARDVYNFDGIDDRGHTPFRAINPDGDIDIEFETGGSVPPLGSARGIVDQSLTPTYGQKEFLFQLNAAGQMQLLFGGSYLTSNSNTVVEPNNKYRMTLIGNVLTYYKNGIATQVSNIIRGNFREPSAPTKIACSQVGAGTFAVFYQGVLKNIKINGVFWPIKSLNKVVQDTEPSDIGAEVWAGDRSDIVINANSTTLAAGTAGARTTLDMPVTDRTTYLVMLTGGVGSRSRWQYQRASDNAWVYGGANLEDSSTTERGISPVFFTTPADCKAIRIYYKAAADTAAGLSIKPLWSLAPTNLWSGNLMPANAATVNTIVSGTSWTVTRTGTSVPADGGRSQDMNSLEVGAWYLFKVDSSASCSLAVYNGSFVQIAANNTNFVLFRAAPINKLYVSPNTKDVAVTITNARLYKIQKISNPILLRNTTPDRWAEGV